VYNNNKATSNNTAHQLWLVRKVGKDVV